MRCGLAWLLVTLALWPPPARAADEPAGDAPPRYTTDVKGTVPDLVGRWFVVSQLALPQGGEGSATLATFWEISAPEGKPALSVRYVSPPPAIKQAIETANKERRPWEPTLEDLRTLREAWDALAPEPRGVATVETVVSGRDAFIEAVAADPAMKDAQFLVQLTADFHPGQGRPMKDVLLYGAQEQQPLGWRGAYASATIAAAPFPIPIAFKGTFRMYRMESVPNPRLLQRVLGVFAGCGRKS